MAEAPRFPSVAELVPHEPPMLLVEELLEWTPQVARVRATVRAGSPFVSGDRMPATILLEYMAQAIAVANGMADRVAGAPSSEVGLLLGTRELDLRVEELAVGDALDLHVEREYSDGQLARYACSAARAGSPAGAGVLARATINVMVGSAEDLRA